MMAEVRRAARRGWRVVALAAGWVWRGQPGVLMTAYLALAILAQWVTTTMHVSGWQLSSGRWLLPIAFWCWRVAGGGRISRRILFFASGVSYGSTVVLLASWWDPQAVALIGIAAAQLALLLSPAVYLVTRLGTVPGAVTGTVPPEARLRLRPRRWILEAAFVTGPVIATIVALSGHLTNQSALTFGKDSAGWALGSFSVLYLLWLGEHSRDESLPLAKVPGVAALGR
jgi:hypothetical protein